MEGGGGGHFVVSEIGFDEGDDLSPGCCSNLKKVALHASTLPVNMLQFILLRSSISGGGFSTYELP